MDARRGYVPEDERFFSSDALETMRTASRHIQYLVNEGYDLKQASTFVGNHFLLSERQRLAVMRSIGTQKELDARLKKQGSVTGLSGKEVWVDGFNTVITLEVLLSGGILLFCMDGCIRDLAALRGTYRIIPETEKAARIMFDKLQKAGVRKVTMLLDEPVSNSGRLKALLADIAEAYAFSIDIRILKDVDRELYGKENVITSDSIILDHCASWVNLTAECVERDGMRALRVWE